MRILQLYVYMTAFMIIAYFVKYNIFKWQKKGTSCKVCKIYIYIFNFMMIYPSELIV